MTTPVSRSASSSTTATQTAAQPATPAGVGEQPTTLTSLADPATVLQTVKSTLVSIKDFIVKIAITVLEGASTLFTTLANWLKGDATTEPEPDWRIPEETPQAPTEPAASTNPEPPAQPQPAPANNEAPPLPAQHIYHQPIFHNAVFHNVQFHQGVIQQSSFPQPVFNQPTFQQPVFQQQDPFLSNPPAHIPPPLPAPPPPVISPSAPSTDANPPAPVPPPTSAVSSNSPPPPSTPAPPSPPQVPLPTSAVSTNSVSAAPPSPPPVPSPSSASSSLSVPPPIPQPRPSAPIADPYASIPATSEEEQKKIFFIIDKLANANLLTLGANALILTKYGNEVEHVHPFRFLQYIFLHPKLKKDMDTLSKSDAAWLGKSRWDSFIDGLAKNLTKLDATVPTCKAGFAKALKVELTAIDPFINRKDWKGMVKKLIELKK